MKKTKLIYLASPYSHKYMTVMRKREDLINSIGAQLCATHRVAIFAPITTSVIYQRILPNKFGHSFTSWKEIDLCAIKHSDEVWVACMEGWRQSIGVTEEIKYATLHKIKVRYIDPKTLKFIPKPKKEAL